MSLRILEKLGEVSVQGPPKLNPPGTGTQGDSRLQFGVPSGGVFDRGAAAIANALVARPEDALVLELSLASLTFMAMCDVCLGIAGPPVSILIDSEASELPGRVNVPAGVIAHIPVPPRAARVYLAGCFCGLRPNTGVSAGDLLEIEQSSSRALRLSTTSTISRSEDSTTVLRIVPGAHTSLFDFDRFLSGAYTVSGRADRVGIRLQEAAFPHELEFPSEPAGFGAVQVTREGVAVILGPDGPTIGGYPKIAHVINADRDLIAQLRPGASLRFALTDVASARTFDRERRAALSRRLAELRISVS